MGYWLMQLAADKNPCTIGPCSLQQTKIHVQLARATCSGQKSIYKWPVQLAADKNPYTIDPFGKQKPRSAY